MLKGGIIYGIKTFIVITGKGHNIGVACREHHMGGCLVFRDELVEFGRRHDI